MMSKDFPEKQNSAFNYRFNKLCDEKDKLIRRGYVYTIVSSILLSFIINSAKFLTAVDVILDCFYVSFMLSLPLWFLFVIIVNEYFKERIEKERYRFCKMTKEKRGWVLH